MQTELSTCVLPMFGSYFLEFYDTKKEAKNYMLLSIPVLERTKPKLADFVTYVAVYMGMKPGVIKIRFGTAENNWYHDQIKGYDVILLNKDNERQVQSIHIANNTEPSVERELTNVTVGKYDVYVTPVPIGTSCGPSTICYGRGSCKTKYSAPCSHSRSSNFICEGKTLCTRLYPVEFKVSISMVIFYNHYFTSNAIKSN